MAIELGRAGRQHEQGDLPLGTGRLELGHELRAAIDLDGARPGRGAAPPARPGSRAAVPAVAVARTPVTLQREIDVDGTEVAPLHPGHGGQVHGVELDQIPGLRDGMRPGVCGWRRGARGGHAAVRAWVWARPATPRRFRSARMRPTIETESVRPSRLQEHDDQFVLAPARIALPALAGRPSAWAAASSSDVDTGAGATDDFLGRRGVGDRSAAASGRTSSGRCRSGDRSAATEWVRA